MKILSILPLVLIAGCSELGILMPPPILENDPPTTTPVTFDPTPAPAPSPLARTVEQFDTTTSQDRAEAVVVRDSAGGQTLGGTIASLGAPTEPGIWLATPLVNELAQGQVTNVANGNSINIELRPNGKPSGAGSQISLAAMRLLDAPLTSLLELRVIRN